MLDRLGIPGRVAWLEVDLGAMFDGPRRSSRYRPVSRFPSSDIDLAFVAADDVSAARLERTIAQAHPLVWSVELFDRTEATRCPRGIAASPTGYASRPRTAP